MWQLKMNQIFSLSEKEKVVLIKWKIEQDEKMIECAKNRGGPMCRPCGPIGGAYTYSFTPTTIGVMIKVTNSVTNNEIDLTNYDEW